MSAIYLPGALALLGFRSTIVLGCGGLAVLLMRRRPAAERHLVWLLTLGGVILLPFLTAIVPAWRVPVPGVTPALPVVAEAAPVQQAASEAPFMGTAAEAASAWGTAGATAKSVAVPGVAEAGVTGAVSAGSLTTRRVVVLVWFAGVLVVAFSTLFSMLHVWLVARRAGQLSDMALADRVRRVAGELGISTPIDLLEGDARTMPMTFGIRRAALLLPSSAAGWPPARQEAVLLHELAHIRRRDALAQVVADIACALYWFNPLVWFAAARMRLEREHACDDVVLMAGARASDYAAELLAVARATRVTPAEARAALALARPSRLRTRLAAVLDDRARSQRIGRDRLLAAGGLALAALVAVATVTPAPAMAAADAGTADGANPNVFAGDRTAPDPAAAGATAAGGPPPVGEAADVPRLANAPRQDGCWDDRLRGAGSIVDRDASGAGYRIVQRSADGLELCMRTTGRAESTTAGAGTVRLDLMPIGGRIELAARSAGGSQAMQIVREPSGLVHTWVVNGVDRLFDDTAQAWRDAMLDVLNSYGSMSAIRGEVASLRGEMAAVRGREASLRGEIATARGHEATLRGEVAAERGREAALRGEIAAIRGEEASLRGQIASIRGQRPADADARIADIERQLAEYDAEARVRAVEQRIRVLQAGGRQQAIEAEIADLDTEGRVRVIDGRITQLNVAGELRAIEGRLADLDADRRVAQLEGQLERQIQELQRVIQRIR